LLVFNGEKADGLAGFPALVRKADRSMSGESHWGKQPCWKYGAEQWRTATPVTASAPIDYSELWGFIFGTAGYWHCCPVIGSPYLTFSFDICSDSENTSTSFYSNIWWDV